MNARAQIPVTITADSTNGASNIEMEEKKQNTHAHTFPEKAVCMRTENEDVLKVSSSTFVLQLVLAAEGGVVDGGGGVR